MNSRRNRLGVATTPQEAAALGVPWSGTDGDDDEPGAPAPETTPEEAAQKLHDPAEQFRILNPQTLEVTLALPREVDEEREETDPETGAPRTVKVRVERMFPKPIRIRYDFKPKDIARHRLWDHFDELRTIWRARLRQIVATDVPEEGLQDYFDRNPGYAEAAMRSPAAREKAREIVAILAECEEIRDVPDVEHPGKTVKKMVVSRVLQDEVAEGLDPAILDMVILSLTRRYDEELRRREVAVGNAFAGVSAPATSTRPSSPTASPSGIAPKS